MIQSDVALSGYTNFSVFDSKLSIKIPFSLGFCVEQPSSLKLKQCLKRSLICQATKQDGAISPRNDNESESGILRLPEVDVGVVGGGQLGRMMYQAASQMAIKVVVLDPQKSCPDTVEEFAKRCGVLTADIDHVDVDTWEKLEEQGVDCQPKASTIRIIQDKYQQKVHFFEHGILLPEFTKIDDLEGAKEAGELFGYPIMIKSRRLAYDGVENVVAKSDGELASAVNTLGGFDHGLYAEKWVPYAKEIAVVVARGRDNSISCYPAVETIHRDNICHIVKAPINVDEKTSEYATEVALKAVNSLEGVGVFAVELFLTRDGKMLLNEVTPGPHNTGHHTIESCHTSQFEQHLRALVGLPLGDPSLKTPAAVMYNILGEEEGVYGLQVAHQLIKRASTISGVAVHWYDMQDMRKQRKMGHITFVGPSFTDILTNLALAMDDKKIDYKSAAAPRVGIIMGSDSDLPIMKKAAEILQMFRVPHEVKIVSAHRTPKFMFSYASSAHKRGIQVIIAGAGGGAAHLPGMVAGLTPLPVIGVPIEDNSVKSIQEMPTGTPVATVGVENATNAGLLAVRILGVAKDNLVLRMSKYQEELEENVMTKRHLLEELGCETYLNIISNPH